MKSTWKTVLALAGSLAASTALADDTIRIGVLTDTSSIYTDLTGNGSIEAAKIAAEEMAEALGGRKVEIISADHGNNADRGAQIARSWLDEQGVDAIVDVPNSAVALAVNQIVRDKNKVLLVSGAATTRLITDQCSPNTILWTIDTHGMATGTALATVEAGGDSWFFLTADYAFGHDMEAQAGAVVTENGGTVIGSVRHPIGNADFSSFLLQAQSSGAKVIALANAGADFQNALKQANEYRITRGGQRVAGMVVYITDVKALGTDVAGGLYLSEPFYWDLNDGTRSFAAKLAERNAGKMPTTMQAGVYSSVIHYLKTVKDMESTDDGLAVIAKMKETPVDDIAFGPGSIRPDGRKLHPQHLFQVKTSEESTSEWDLYKPLATVEGERAWYPMNVEACPMAAGQ